MPLCIGPDWELQAITAGMLVGGSLIPRSLPAAIYLMEITSNYNASMEIFTPNLPDRPPGLHLSTIYSAIARDLYPKWFKKYSDEDRVKGEVTHFEKGLVLEDAWGLSLSQMIGADFSRPIPKQVEGVWCSPDGMTYDPPTIYECKVTLKSCNPETSPIEHEKFITWKWQIMGYCYAFNCHEAILHVLHLCGDYKDRPWTPKAAGHHFQFTADELAAHWAWLMQEADERGLRDNAR